MSRRFSYVPPVVGPPAHSFPPVVLPMQAPCRGPCVLRVGLAIRVWAASANGPEPLPDPFPINERE
jgi:hypothetical protein